MRTPAGCCYSTKPAHFAVTTGDGNPAANRNKKARRICRAFRL
jgi:hypothetical protein